MPKYRVFSGPYFPAFRVSLRIQPECGKIQTRKNSVLGYFSPIAFQNVFLTLNFSYYGDYLKKLQKPEIIELKINVSDSGISSLLYPLLFTKRALFHFDLLHPATFLKVALFHGCFHFLKLCKWYYVTQSVPYRQKLTME